MRGENPETTRRATSRTPSAGAAFSGRNPPPSGYRLSGLAAGDPLFEQGLRNGDVVHAVAGVAVATGQALHLAFETARLVGPVDVDLTRNGKRSTLSLLLP
jgi:S1-C subfamily serine protease